MCLTNHVRDRSESHAHVSAIQLPIAPLGARHLGGAHNNMFPYLVAPKPHGLRFPSRGSRNHAKALRKPMETICSITFCSSKITFHSAKNTFRSIEINFCSIKITFCLITITFCLIKITISSIKSLFVHSL